MFPDLSKKFDHPLLGSIKNIALFLIYVTLIYRFGKLPNTNAFFTDQAMVKNNVLAAGYWIPEIHMSVVPENPDGKKDFYKTTPCVTLTADIQGENDGTKIYYEFSDDENPIDDGTEYTGTCIEIPDGNPTHFQAQAVNKENKDWKSEIIAKDFKVKTAADPGDVVINELMWMGSFGDEDDEWIELRNTTNEDVDISNWRITHGGTGSAAKAHLEIPAGYSIKANGFFLITKKKWNETQINLSEKPSKEKGLANVANLNLKNSGEELILQDDKKKIIDSAWKDDQSWPAGWQGIFLHMSMERVPKPGDGKLAENWRTCINLDCNNKEFWHAKGLNFGTPGKENVFLNDLIKSNLSDLITIEEKIKDQQNKNTD